MPDSDWTLAGGDAGMPLAPGKDDLDKEFDSREKAQVRARTLALRQEECDAQRQALEADGATLLAQQLAWEQAQARAAAVVNETAEALQRLGNCP
jgi:hypothetical protein